MKFNCSNCSQRLEVRDRYAGQEIECPTCHTTSLVPQASSTVAELAAFFQSTGIEPGFDWASAIGGDKISSGDMDTRYANLEVVAENRPGCAIHLAEDINLRRKVLMKHFRIDSADLDGMNHFIKEAQITGQLEHPGIVPVYEFGIDSDGNIFSSSKLIEGESLAKVLSRLRGGDMETVKGCSLNRLLRIFLQVCDTIAYAHDRQVIHRALSSENIFLGEYGEVLVLEWGDAQTLNPSDTLSNDAIYVEPIECDEGTPAPTSYIAPEQACGESSCDSRSDIYSLGAILYDILALRPPYLSETRGEMKDLRTLKSRDKKWPKRPHCPNGRVPAALAAVAMRALSENPEDRYGTVNDLRKEIENYLGGFPTLAENASLARQAGLFWQRHQAACITIVTALGLLLFGAAFSIVVNKQERDTAVAAKVDLEKAIDKKRLARLTNVPQLLEMAKQSIDACRFEEAATLLSNCLQYDPANPECYLLASICEIGRTKDISPSAQEYLNQYSALLNSSANPIIEAIASEEVDWAEIRKQLRALGFPKTAASLEPNKGAERKAYASYIKSIYGDIGVGLTWWTDYNHNAGRNIKFHRVFTGYQLNIKSPPNASEIRLDALEGIPLKIIDLQNFPVSDLTPLANMSSLKVLRLINCQVEDLSPLVESNIEILTTNRKAKSLVPLAKMEKLLSFREVLKSTDFPSNLTPLAGKRFEYLSIVPEKLRQFQSIEADNLLIQDNWSAEPNDLSQLSGRVFKYLGIRGLKLADIDPLATITADHLEIHSHRENVLDLGPLANAKVRSLEVDSWFDTGKDLSFLIENPGIESFTTNSSALLGPIAKSSVKNLQLEIPRSGSKLIDQSLCYIAPLLDSPNLVEVSASDQIKSTWSLITPGILKAMIKMDRSGAEKEVESVIQAYRNHPAFGQESDDASARLRERVAGWFDKGDEFYVSKKHRFNGHTYQWVGLGADWHAARDFARDMGGYLVTITSAEEQQFLVKKLL